MHYAHRPLHEGEERADALVALLDVLECAEDDVCHLLGVGDADRVGGALDLHDLASLSALGHEAVRRHGDVLVELPEHEP